MKTTILILSFIAGQMIAHAWHQPIFNELDRIESEIEAYRDSAVVGYVLMDAHTKQFCFVER